MGQLVSVVRRLGTAVPSRGNVGIGCIPLLLGSNPGVKQQRRPDPVAYSGQINTWRRAAFFCTDFMPFFALAFDS